MKRLTGSRRQQKTGAFDLAPNVPPCPAWLDDEAKAFWCDLAPQLGLVLTRVDGPKLAVFCQALADYRRAVELLREKGEDIVTDKGNVISHPAVGRKNRAALIIAKYGSDFGLDPASRARLTVPEKAPDSDAEREFFADPPLRMAQ